MYIPNLFGSGQIDVQQVKGVVVGHIEGGAEWFLVLFATRKWRPEAASASGRGGSGGHVWREYAARRLTHLDGVREIIKLLILNE